MFILPSHLRRLGRRRSTEGAMQGLLMHFGHVCMHICVHICMHMHMSCGMHNMHMHMCMCMHM